MTTTDTGPQTARFASFLRWHHRTTPDALIPTSTPGYWQRKEPCGGAAGGCREPIHTFVFNEGPIHHTISYFDEVQRDERGRFLSPYRTWRAAQEETRA